MNKYFKLIVAVFALCLWGVRLHAQSFQWVYAAGPTIDNSRINHTRPGKVFTDSKENVYFCFDFIGTEDLTIAGERVFVPEEVGRQCTGVACYDCQGQLKGYRMFYGKNRWGQPSDSPLNTAAMVDDTLVLCFYGYFDSLYVCDSERVLDTVACNVNYALWLNTDDGRPIRVAHTGTPRHMHYYNNRLYLLGQCGAYDTIPGMMDDSTYVQIFTPQGEKIRHLALDYYSSYPSIYHHFAVYHDKYYTVFPTSNLMDSCRFGNQQYTGRDTLYANSVFACFDSLGRCLWSRLLNSILHPVSDQSRIAIDTSTDMIYLVSEEASFQPSTNLYLGIFDGDTIWGVSNTCARLVLACYDTLGNKLWMKYSRDSGEIRSRNIVCLPDHKLAFGGGANYYDAVFEGFHTNALDGLDSFASYLSIYDCVKDSVVMLQVNRRQRYASPRMHYATDRNGNLYFASQLERDPRGNYVVCGNDTIRLLGRGASTIVYGRYGWGCDTVAHWPGPPQYTLTLNANQDDMGFVTGAGIYSGGSRVPISATPYPGHTFDRWSDGTSINPRTVILDTDSTITAHFVKTQGIAPADHPHMALYPNPATGKVQILGLAGEAQYVEILDMTGRTAATFRHTSTLDISHLPQGSYIVKIQTAEGSIQHLKLIKE